MLEPVQNLASSIIFPTRRHRQGRKADELPMRSLVSLHIIIRGRLVRIIDRIRAAAEQDVGNLNLGLSELLSVKGNKLGSNATWSLPTTRAFSAKRTAPRTLL